MCCFVSCTTSVALYFNCSQASCVTHKFPFVVLHGTVEANHFWQILAAVTYVNTVLLWRIQELVDDAVKHSSLLEPGSYILFYLCLGAVLQN